MNEERKTIKAWEEMGRRKKLKKRYTIWGIFVFISGVFLFGLGLFETITDSAYQHVLACLESARLAALLVKENSCYKKIKRVKGRT
jgi:hypothetical protein